MIYQKTIKKKTLDFFMFLVGDIRTLAVFSKFKKKIILSPVPVPVQGR